MDKNATEMIEPGDLLTVEQAAALLSVRPSTVRAWLTQSKLPRVKLGRLTRILRQDCKALIHAGRVTSIEAPREQDLPTHMSDTEAK